MPRTTNNSSIKTIWENNSDTPITATNLSKALDLIASYKNFNVAGMSEAPDDFHGEYSLLVINPLDPSQLLFKRGSVLQIINEASDDLGNPIIDANSHYKIFDVGLDDIIITSNDTDITLSGDKSEWGSPGDITQWFVYLADKDDSSVYNKDTPSAYGGGAQIIVSKNNSGPYRAQVPGRPMDEYSLDDTRIIGGLKTNGDTITEVWDIAGKYYEVKSKMGYFILDENDGENSYNYRRIDFRDLNTNRNSQLNGSLTVQGDTNLIGGLSGTGDINLTTDSFKISSTDILTSLEFDGSMNAIIVDGNIDQEGDFSILGNSSFNGSVSVSGTITHSGSYNLTGPLNQTGEMTLDGFFNQTGPVSMGDKNTTPINSTGTWTHNGLFDHSGIYRIQGSVEVAGQYELVSDQLTIRTETPYAHDTDDNPLFQFFQFIVPNPGSYEDPDMYTYHQGRMEVNGGTYSHGGSASFSINWNRQSEMTVFAHEYNYNDAGSAPYGGYNITSDFRVKKNNSEPVIEIINENKTIHTTGSTTLTIEDNDSVSVVGDGITILTVEKDPSNNVVINGNLTVTNGSLIGSVTGNADTATEFETPLVLDFADTSSDMSDGSVTIHGNEGEIKVDLMIDRDKWYNINDLDPSPGTSGSSGVLDTRYYKISSIDPAPGTSSGTGLLDTRYYPISSIDPNPGSDTGTGILDTRYLTITEVQSLFSGEGSFNLQWTGIANRPTINLTGGLIGTLDLSDNDITDVSVDVDPSQHNHNDIYYTKTDLADASGTDNNGDVPEINWDVLTSVPYGFGIQDNVARNDHIHIISTDQNDLLGGSDIVFSDQPVNMNFINSMIHIIGSSMIFSMKIDTIEIAGSYILVENSSDVVMFWFSDGIEAQPTDPLATRVVTIDLLSVTQSQINYTNLLIDTFNDDSSGDFSASLGQDDSIIVSFNVTTVSNNIPFSSTPNILIGEPYKSNYRFNLKTDFSLLPGSYESGISSSEDNYVLTKNPHLLSEHKFITTNKEQFMLDSTSSDFLNIATPAGHAAEIYSELKEFSYPSAYNPEMYEKSITDKIAIHANNIYVPSDYTPGGASSRDYLDVTSTLDPGTGQITSYSINDVPILSYVESNYYTKTELDDGQLDNRYYLKSEVDGLISTELGDYVTTTYLTNNHYNQSEVYTKTELDGGQLDGRYFTETEITNDYYDRDHIDNYHYTAAEVDDTFQVKETAGWGSTVTEEFVYARIFSGTKPSSPQLGDIFIGGGSVEICSNAGLKTWTVIN